MRSKLQCQFGIRCLLVLALSATSLSADTITGAVRGRLTLAGSPYTVAGDLRVLAGDSLRIDPGVVLSFQQSSSFIVEGRLIAVGADEDSIFFSSAAAAPSSGDWNGVFLYGATMSTVSHAAISHAATGMTCDGTASVIEFTRFENNVNGIDCLNGATATVRYNLFFKNENAAIRCIASSPLIHGNLLSQNALTGFESAVVCNAAAPRIQHNLIYANGHSGIDCSNGSAAQIYQNTLANNEFGVTISDSDPVLSNNLVTGSLSGISCENAVPAILYNNVFGNLTGNFLDCPAGVGEMVAANFNGDVCDVFNNLSLNPRYVNTASGDFRIGAGSPCIDAGNPDNPAGSEFIAPRPDIGCLEFDGSISEVLTGEPVVPAQHRLEQNVPNPFNPGTTISYVVGGASAQPVRLAIYNSLGQLVREVLSGSQPPGQYRVYWSGEDDRGRPVGSGVYFSRLEVDGALQIRKMTLSR